MLSQDKCLPIAYKCLGFTVQFVLEKYYSFKMVFVWYRETVNTSQSCPQPLPRMPTLPPGASHRPTRGQAKGGIGGTRPPWATVPLELENGKSRSHRGPQVLVL